MDIYLDTNLWNELYRQRIGAAGLIATLESNNKRLVLSDENVYECAKTFFKKGTSGLQEGAALFDYLQTYVSNRIPITKDNMALVAAEMQELQWNIGAINTFITPDDYEKVQVLIGDHAAGNLKTRTVQHIERRRASGASDRAGIVLYLKNMPRLKSVLLSVSPAQLPAWIRLQRSSQDGINYLAWQIKHYFDEHPFNEAYEYACALERTRINRVSMGMISRNLYFNWRCAHRVSIPSDLFPDSNHIINANYCDVYATKESGQAEYAALLLTPATSVRVYDPQTPIDEWLLSLT